MSNPQIVIRPNRTKIVQVGRQGPAGVDGTGLNPIDSETDDAVLIGQPIYIKSNGHIGLAGADAFPEARVAGVALTNTTIGFSCSWVLTSLVTRLDWTPVTGTLSLSTGVFYFLSPISGMMTNVSPTATGYSVLLGKAVTPLSFLFQPLYPIKL